MPWLFLVVVCPRGLEERAVGEQAVLPENGGAKARGVPGVLRGGVREELLELLNLRAAL